MPISNKTFDSAPNSVNPKLLDLFIKNPNKAYSYEELNNKFTDRIALMGDLLVLLMLKRIEQRSLNEKNYYRFKKSA